MWYLKVETLDGRGPAPSIKTVNPIRTPYLVYAATILSGVLKDGSAQITRFPQKGVNKGWPLGQQDVWIPSIANQQVYIKMDYVEKLPLGIEQLPSPYNFE